MAEPTLHRALEPVAFLLGKWRGAGKGQYPDIEPFSYKEEVRFWHLGRPILLYLQKTWSPDGAAPMHSEMGYWRPQPDGTIEAVLTHGFGVVEIGEGTVTDRQIEIASSGLWSTTSAKEIDALTRTLEVRDDALVYSVGMAFGGHPLQEHLSGRLERV